MQSMIILAKLFISISSLFNEYLEHTKQNLAQQGNSQTIKQANSKFFIPVGEIKSSNERELVTQSQYINNGPWWPSRESST